ncbi:MAG: hypothetical protein LBF58_12235 [Deltaproteobacteria bacterium]|jgi:uncharacterized protein YPO0396|nr:hypothetical protein [Deltaproteobacteria bacterium]
MSYSSHIPSKEYLKPPSPSLLDGVKVVLKADQQYRLVRFQAHNWGTFSDYHDIPISEEGYLITGPSGSGKTTLLDGYSTMLIPPKWLEYNSAARDVGGRRDRNVMSYVRGAWGTLRAEGEAEPTTQYLRPNATWSALALTFKKGHEYLTMIQLFWVKGSEINRISRHYFIVKRQFSLEELDFAGKNFDLRELKASQHFDLESNNFEDYHAFYGQNLGLKEDNALKLLQKTQSMKNIEDLDSFLRNFMLDEPDTFQAAHQMVEQFEALNAAHEAVNKARLQMEVLGPIRLNLPRYEQAGTMLHDAQEMVDCLDVYADLRKKKLLDDELERLGQSEAKLTDELNDIGNKIKLKNTELSDLREQYSGNEGNLLDQYGQKREERIKRLEVVKANAERYQAAKRFLGFGQTGGESGFREAQAMAQAELDGQGDRRRILRQEYRRLVGEERARRADLEATEREIAALREQNGNVPAEYWELRKELLAALGAQGGDGLPFLGQLVAVKPDGARWEGAIERALAPLATSVLVDEELYGPVSQHANGASLGGRLSYLKVPRLSMGFAGGMAPPPGSLLSKLEFKPGPYADFLALELGRRLNLTCAETMAEFGKNFASLTPEGQVKLDNERHEKDDRRELNDVRHFRLGFDPTRKLAAWNRHREGQVAGLAGLAAGIEQIDSSEESMNERAERCKAILGLTWEGIDLPRLEDEISHYEEMIKQLLSKNFKVSELRKSVLKREAELNDLLDERAKRELERKNDRYNHQLLSKERTELTLKPQTRALTDETRRKLLSRFSDFGHLNLKNLNEIVLKVARELDKALADGRARQADHGSKLFASFNEFMARWPGESLDLQARVSYAKDFLKILERLELDDLPRLEDKFAELLRKFSTQNAGHLSSWLSENFNEIFKRMAVVNESLAGLPFNRVGGKPTYLKIKVTPRHLDEVDKFKEDLKSVTRDQYVRDPFLDEERFGTLKRLIADLSSTERDKVSWRERVLDVRKHVEFSGHEEDGDGKEIETYRSGAGKSGGQRQKLAAICLAAALRYQLGGRAYGYPRFGTVVFDEAFDKIDNDLTVIALEIFKNLGFQMILATPMKNIPAAEPYIGGAVYVSISGRDRSSVTPVIYDHDRKKLLWPDDPARSPGPGGGGTVGHEIPR